MARHKKIKGTLLWHCMLALCLFLAIPSFANDTTWKQYHQHIRARQFSQAANLLQPLAENKDPQACYELAKLYRNGTGVTADSKKARELLIIAAEQNHIEAQYLLGVLYYKGIGGPKNTALSKQWLGISKDNKHPRADSLLSQIEKENTETSLTNQQALQAVEKGNITLLENSKPNTPLPDIIDNNSNHLIAIALLNNQRKMAEWLLKQGADINQQNPDGESALHLSTTLANTNWASWLLKNGANPNVKNNAGKTPLHLAAEKNQPEIIQLLLKNHANTQLKDKEQQTALDKAAIKNATQALTAFKEYGLVVATSSNFDFRLSELQQKKTIIPPLQVAVERGDLELVKFLLPKAETPWAHNLENHTIITLSASLPNSEILSYLLNQSHGQGLIGPQQRNALFFALSGNHPKNLTLLLQQKIDPLIQDIHGDNAMNFALNIGSPLSHELLTAIPDDQWQEKWLPLAAQKNISNMVLALINSHLNINAMDQQGRTALWYAVKNNQAPLVNALISAGANPSIADDGGNSVLHIAALEDTDTIKTLLKIAQKTAINQANDNGSTPLHLAASRGAHEQIKQLINAGSALDLRDKNGNTPLIAAVMANDVVAVNLLLRSGASTKKRNNNKQNALSIAHQLGFNEIVITLKEKEKSEGILSIFN